MEKKRKRIGYYQDATLKKKKKTSDRSTREKEESSLAQNGMPGYYLYLNTIKEFIVLYHDSAST